ncbi:hypothetical protein AYO49_00500 [Verrucomicrobiaceae bacterium SCGC AG-212-N21]|nr:hypothetical protein AYO49_00500 [Verrucomicrobiaceae bacterium SCGC AG-212-N21]
MAIKLSANYSKKLGLPAYSSHSFSASVEIELSDLSQVEAECAKLYALLQQSVDREIQQVGFVPDPAQYGQQTNGHGRTHGNGHHSNGSNGHRSTAPRNGNGERWNCTEGQRGFILRIIGENNLDKQETENLAVQLFGVGVKQLNKMQASQLIEELLAKAGKPRPARWQQQSQPQPTGSS